MRRGATSVSRSTAEGKWRMRRRSPKRVPIRSCRARPSSKARIMPPPSRRSAERSSAGRRCAEPRADRFGDLAARQRLAPVGARIALFVVVLVIVVVLVMLLGACSLAGGGAGAGAGFHRDDERTCLHLGAGVEADQCSGGGCEEPLFFQYLQHSSRHFAGTSDQTRQ